jgi:hypothetical protein
MIHEANVETKGWGRGGGGWEEECLWMARVTRTDARERAEKRHRG